MLVVVMCVLWQLTISVWGKDEEVIDKPMAPNDIKKILYDRCFPFDPIQAVLQQELIINIGTFITTSPEYFRGILKIRIGWTALSLLITCTIPCLSLTSDTKQYVCKYVSK